MEYCYQLALFDKSRQAEECWWQKVEHAGVLVKTKSGNSTPFEQQMPMRLGRTLLNECVSCAKYQILILYVFRIN